MGATAMVNADKLISTRLEQVMGSDYYNDNPAEAVKKLDELFQNPMTLAWLRKSEKANVFTLWFVAVCRTCFRLKATLKLCDGAEGAELDPQAWTKIYLMFLDRAESALERGDVESALATIEDLCATPDVAKLALGDKGDKIAQRMVEIWAKAKLRLAEQAIAQRNERVQFQQQAQNVASADGNSGGYTQEQSRIMQQENEQEMRRLQHKEWMENMRWIREDRERRRARDRERIQDGWKRTRSFVESMQGIDW
ncbi:MAG: hypothetical protein IJ991_00920 [Thermoguttaceae bacterium]|nr:hypothetical protein [Thermoguttaceae bacterium]